MDSVLSFDNIGGDARLVVPCPQIPQNIRQKVFPIPKVEKIEISANNSSEKNEESNFRKNEQYQNSTRTSLPSHITNNEKNEKNVSNDQSDNNEGINMSQNMLENSQYSDNIPNYSHLANFIRNAPKAQKNYLWQKIAEEITKILPNLKEGKMLWMSTSGLGVSWLHVRLDTTPKYYSWEAYQTG